jgi:hypothetical protein
MTDEAAGASPLERMVRPVAWVCASALEFLCAGTDRARCTTELRRVETEALDVPIYSGVEVRAMLAAERERFARMAENYDLGTPEGHAIARCIRGA